MTIGKTELPENSLLKTNNLTYDYVDSFQGQFVDQFQNIGTTEIGKSFFLVVLNGLISYLHVEIN